MEILTDEELAWLVDQLTEAGIMEVIYDMQMQRDLCLLLH